jgi:hypothetical protein
LNEPAPAWPTGEAGLHLPPEIMFVSNYALASKPLN